MNENLNAWDCQDFAAIVRKRPGRPWNLNDKNGRRLVGLVKNAATGESDPSWNAVGMSLVALLFPRLLAAAWERRPGH
ncbi:MAG: hypothetical protein ACM33U_04405 [Solirubrobacterales bacterium]